MGEKERREVPKDFAAWEHININLGVNLYCEIKAMQKK